MSSSRDVRGEFFVVPLQTVPMSEWGHFRPRDRQVEAFRRAANALEQQWISDLQSTWNVTRWYGTDVGKKGRRNRRRWQPKTEPPSEPPIARPRWAQEQKHLFKTTGSTTSISTEPGEHRITRRKLAFLLHWVQNGYPANLDLYKWKTETVQRCLHWLQGVVGVDEHSKTLQEVEQMLLERLRTKRTRMTHEKEKRKGGLLNFIKVFHTNKAINRTALRQVLHDPDVIKLHPDPKAADQLQVCDKLTVPLLRVLDNNGHTR